MARAVLRYAFIALGAYVIFRVSLAGLYGFSGGCLPYDCRSRLRGRGGSLCRTAARTLISIYFKDMRRDSSRACVDDTKFRLAAFLRSQHLCLSNSG